MNVKNVEKENGAAKVTIEIARDEFQTALDKAYAKIRKDIMIPGFRKGKAPRKFVERMYGSQVFYEDAVNEIFPEIYEAAIVKQELKAVGQPSVTDMQTPEDGSVVLTVSTELYPEVTLGQYYRIQGKDGVYYGGPMYYIKNGLGKHWQFLAVLYSLFGVLTVFGTGNATQVNTIVAAIDTALTEFNVVSGSALSTLNLVVGIIVAMLVAMVLLGGIKRIGSVSEKLVPFMALTYVVLALGVVLLNLPRLPEVFTSIVAGAFNPAAFTGGAVGSLFLSMQKGVSRGIFSNEAGLGTGSIAHACADTKKPVKQGVFGIFEVFADTIVICTLTAMTIICSGVDITFGQKVGSELITSAFATMFGVKFASVFVALALTLFAFTTVLGWSLYGSCVQYLFGLKVAKGYQVLFIIIVVVGAVASLDVVWDIADTFNGLMAIPNFIALFALSGVVAKLTKEYFADKTKLKQ